MKRALLPGLLLMVALSASLPMAAAAAEPDESDPLIAAYMFSSQRYVFERMQAWCATQGLGSAEAIGKARADWDHQHASLQDKASKILQSRLSEKGRATLEDRRKSENDASEAKLATASLEKRTGWCEGLPSKILAPSMNLMRRPVLVDAIQSAP